MESSKSYVRTIKISHMSIYDLFVLGLYMDTFKSGYVGSSITQVGVNKILDLNLRGLTLINAKKNILQENYAKLKYGNPISITKKYFQAQFNKAMKFFVEGEYSVCVAYKSDITTLDIALCQQFKKFIKSLNSDIAVCTLEEKPSLLKKKQRNNKKSFISNDRQQYWMMKNEVTFDNCIRYCFLDIKDEHKKDEMIMRVYHLFEYSPFFFLECKTSFFDRSRYLEIVSDLVLTGKDINNEL